MRDNMNIDLPEKIANLKRVMDDVLDEYNLKKITKPQMEARMVYLSKQLNALETQMRNLSND